MQTEHTPVYSPLDVFHRFSHTAEALGGQLQRTLRPHGLTMSQVAILEAIVRHGPLNHRQIGRTVGRSSGNVTTVTDNLERRNLVRRERDKQDRRCVTVHLTPEGEKVTRTILPAYTHEIMRVMAALSKEERDVLARLCDALEKTIPER